MQRGHTTGDFKRIPSRQNSHMLDSHTPMTTHAKSLSIVQRHESLLALSSAKSLEILGIVPPSPIRVPTLPYGPCSHSPSQRIID